MSDTPRTDAEAQKSRPPFAFVTRKFAEDLERECNQRKADWNKACDEQEAMTAKAVGWQNQAELNARLLVECREKAERYRLEANAMMAQRDEAKRKVSELQAGLDDSEEYGTEEINAAVDHRPQLAAALCKAAELRQALQSVMDWNPKPEYWERPETVARFEADMARAREVLEEAQETKPHHWEDRALTAERERDEALNVLREINNWINVAVMRPPTPNEAAYAINAWGDKIRPILEVTE